MKKTILASMLFTAWGFTSTAQTADLAPTPKEKKYEHVVGVQLNSLIRQVFNFNGTPATDANPYLITYNMNSIKSGWGFRFGGGFVSNNSSNSDGITSRTTKINDLHLRLGVEKAFKLTYRWTTGVGLDLVLNNNDDHTTSITHSFDSVTVNTSDVISSYGGGAMAWLRYSFTKNIAIGTEASMYYITGNEKQSVETIFSHSQNQQPAVKTDNKLSQGNFNVPVVFYLSVKF